MKKLIKKRTVILVPEKPTYKVINLTINKCAIFLTRNGQGCIFFKPWEEAYKSDTGETVESYVCAVRPKKTDSRLYYYENMDTSYDGFITPDKIKNKIIDFLVKYLRIDDTTNNIILSSIDNDIPLLFYTRLGGNINYRRLALNFLFDLGFKNYKFEHPDKYKKFIDFEYEKYYIEGDDYFYVYITDEDVNTNLEKYKRVEAKYNKTKQVTAASSEEPTEGPAVPTEELAVPSEELTEELAVPSEGPAGTRDTDYLMIEGEVSSDPGINKGGRKTNRRRRKTNKRRKSNKRRKTNKRH